jgi:hypothetical protein
MTNQLAGGLPHVEMQTNMIEWCLFTVLKMQTISSGPTQLFRARGVFER